MSKETLNKIFIEGVLNKKEFRTGEKNGNNFIAGTLEVKINDENIIPVEVFSFEKTKDGKWNKIFDGLNTVKNEYVSITDVDNPEKASKIRISAGQIRVDEFLGNDKQLHQGIKYTTNFVNRVDKIDPKAEFEIEFIIKGFRSEIVNDEETGNGYVDGWIITYQGDLKPLTLKAKKSLYEKLEMNVEPREVLKVWGKIVNNVVTETITEEAEFGESKEKIVTNTKKERVIDGAKRSTRIIEDEEWQQLMKQREKFVETMKGKESFEKQNEKEFGFEDDDDEDLPFTV